MWAYRDWVVQGVQREPAVRPVHRLAARRRPAAEPDAGPAHRDRLQPLQRDDRRGRVDRGRSGSTATRSTAPRPRRRRGSGLTAGCAVCHDHKFDPISAKEFYSLYAFFYSAADPALDGNVSTDRAVREAADAGAEGGARRGDEGRGRRAQAARSERPRRPSTPTRPTPKPPPAGGASRDVLVRRRLPARRDQPQHDPQRRRLGDRPAVRGEVRPARCCGRRTRSSTRTRSSSGCAPVVVPANGDVRGVGAARPEAPADGDRGRSSRGGKKRVVGRRSRRRIAVRRRRTLGHAHGAAARAGRVGEAERRRRRRSG